MGTHIPHTEVLPYLYKTDRVYHTHSSHLNFFRLFRAKTFVHFAQAQGAQYQAYINP